MTVRTWVGGVDSSFDTPANWTPEGVPQPGDNAVIFGGTVDVTNEDLSRITLGVGSPYGGLLRLHNAIMGDFQVSVGFRPSVSAPGVATIDVSGCVAFVGHVGGPVGVPDDGIGLSDGTLTIDLQANSRLLNSGDLSNQFSALAGHVHITAASGARFANDGTITADMGDVVIDPDMCGTGTVAIVQDLSRHAGGFSIPSKVEFGGFVGRHQSVDFVPTEPNPGLGTPLNDKLLVLDRPREFLATIEDFGPRDTIELAGTSVTAERFDHGVLKLFDKCHAVASLHFSGCYGTSQFAVTESGGNSFITFSGTPHPTASGMMGHCFHVPVS